MSLPLVSEENKLTMKDTVEQLNMSVEKGSCFDFKVRGDEIDEDDGFWDWHSHKCCVCDKIWYNERATCNGTTAEAIKLHDGLRCPHCHRGYCSFEHMQPQILIPNTDDINKLTGIKSYVIYKMCVSYLDHMTMLDAADSFCSKDNGYDIMFINGSISKSMNDIELENLRYILMNQDVEYGDIAHYLREDVVKFVNEHFNDCEEHKQRIATCNRYMSTGAIMVISTFVGCRNCLKCVK